jgi:tetratricopeptide (TPR) repeat protein
MRTEVSQALKLVNAGQLSQARQLCQQVLQADSRDADALHVLGLVETRDYRYEEAISHLEQAIALRPDSAEMRNNLGTSLRTMGRMKEATTRYQQALELDPESVTTYFYITQINKFRDDDGPLAKIEQMLLLPRPAKDQCDLHFAAAKICDDRGRYDRAFYHFQMGNNARGAIADPAKQEQRIRDTINVFQPDWVAAHQPSNAQGPRMIFVVGMPRSGTTLAEQILGCHDNVFTAGELPDIPSISAALSNRVAGKPPYPQSIHQVDVADFGRAADAYWSRVAQFNTTNQPIVVDKNPGNFQHLGLIWLMFPGVKIVHCRRDARDTCLSCYFQKFVAGHEYSFHLSQLGRFYRGYEHLMQHWRQTLSLDIFDLDYESVVENPETTIRQLTEFCELPWTDQFLKPHENRNPVATASTQQVRQPLYRTSVARWKNYEPYIGPLQNALEHSVWH